MATGLPYENGRKTEILDLGDPTFECTGLQDYPMNVKDGGGGLLKDNVPLICGGYNGSEIGECFKLVNKTWSPMQDGMQEARYHAGYGNVVINESLWKSGGMNTSTSELIDGKSSRSYQDLPEAMHAHCSIKINDSVILVTGGNSGSAKNQTFYHDFKNGKWSNGPALNHARYMHACKSFNLDGKMHLVVAGGFGVAGKLKSVEFLSMESADKGWFSGTTTDLPEAMAEFSMVHSLNQKSLFAIGGDDGGKRNAILELECEGSTVDSCNWDTSETKLKYAREDLVAYLIPDSLVDELCN